MTTTAPSTTGYELYRKYVQAITKRCGEDPGVRVALRRGLRRGLDGVQPMHRIVAPWLPDRRGEAEERAYYAVAAMIADSPRHTFNSQADNEESPAPDNHNATPAPGNAPVPPELVESDSAHNQPRSALSSRVSLGASFAHATTVRGGQAGGLREDTAETRLNLLTRQGLDGLHRHLPAAVRLLRDNDADVDFASLLADLMAWPRHSKTISRRWLQDYYRIRHAASEAAARRRDEKNSDENRDGPDGSD
ncbi:type I-E CRISPR-associated protein Cse2/CasB [Streptomyces sp. NPDC054829]